MKGFRQFILRGNLVDLSVAVVIGAAFSGLVKGFTGSFINPLIALFGSTDGLDKYKFVLHGQKFTYGVFLDDAITFLVTAAVVYFFVVLPVARLLRMFEKDKAATERPCPVCTRSIPIEAKRCPECTSMLTEGTTSETDVPEPRPAPVA